MIERIAIQGFKSLKDVTLDLGAFNVLIGTNASGKSNFLDALRIVKGIAHGFTIDEIFSGKPRTSTTDLWEPIRGGLALAAYHESDSKEARSTPNPIRICVTLSSPSIGRVPVEYSIEISAAHGRVLTERLKRGYETIFDTAPASVVPPSRRLRHGCLPDIQGNSGRHGLQSAPMCR